MLDGGSMPETSSETCSKKDSTEVPDYIMAFVDGTDEIRAKNRALEEKRARKGGLMPLDNTTAGPGDNQYSWISRRGD